MARRATIGDPGMARDPIGAEEPRVHRGFGIGLREPGDRARLGGGLRDKDMIERRMASKEAAAEASSLMSRALRSDAAGRADDKQAAAVKIDRHAVHLMQSDEQRFALWRRGEARDEAALGQPEHLPVLDALVEV